MTSLLSMFIINFNFSCTGILTGNCIQSDVNATVKVCEIKGWCPTERDINPLYV